MLKSKLIHPDITAALAAAGHGSKVLIADGNYPASTKLGPNAELVCLNLMPGMVSGTDALRALVSAIPVEAAAVMQTLKDGPYAMKDDPPIWAKYAAILKEAGFEAGGDQPFEQIERFAFYDAAESPDVALTIQTGEQRIYANLLLTIGVVMP